MKIINILFVITLISLSSVTPSENKKLDFLYKKVDMGLETARIKDSADKVKNLLIKTISMLFDVSDNTTRESALIKSIYVNINEAGYIFYQEKNGFGINLENLEYLKRGTLKYLNQEEKRFSEEFWESIKYGQNEIYVTLGIIGDEVKEIIDILRNLVSLTSGLGKELLQKGLKNAELIMKNEDYVRFLKNWY